MLIREISFVAVDKNFSRLKVKHPGFVALFHLSNGFNARNLVEFVRTTGVGTSNHELDELVAYYPQLKAQVRL